MKKLLSIVIAVLFSSVSFAQTTLPQVFNTTGDDFNFLIPSLCGDGNKYLCSFKREDDCDHAMIYSLPDFVSVGEFSSRNGYHIDSPRNYYDFDSGIFLNDDSYENFITRSLFNDDNSWEWIEVNSDYTIFNIMSENGVIASISASDGTLDSVIKYQNKVYIVISTYVSGSDSFAVYEYDPQTVKVSGVKQDNGNFGKIRKVLKNNRVNIETSAGDVSASGILTK